MLSNMVSQAWKSLHVEPFVKNNGIRKMSNTIHKEWLTFFNLSTSNQGVLMRKSAWLSILGTLAGLAANELQDYALRSTDRTNRTEREAKTNQGKKAFRKRSRHYRSSKRRRED